MLTVFHLVKLAAGFPTCCHLLEKNPQWEKCLRHVLASNTHYFSQSLTRLPARQLISPIIQFLGKKGTPRLILSQNNNQVSANSKYGIIVTAFRVSHITTEQQAFYNFQIQIKLIELRLASKQQVI